MPHVTALDAAHEFEALFEERAGLPYTFRLQGGWDVEGSGRFSFLCFEPYRVIGARGNRLGVLEPVSAAQGGEPAWDLVGDPFEMLDREYRRIAAVPVRRDLPFRFQGGAVGFLGYGMRRFVERVPERISDDLGLPDMLFAFYDVVFAFDHLTGKVYVVSSGLSAGDGAEARRAAERLEGAVERLIAAGRRARESSLGRMATSGREAPDGAPAEESFASPAMDKATYIRCVARVKEYIAAGDVYQVNFTQRFSVPVAASPRRVFRALQKTNPAPFGAYLNGGDWCIVSVSPERFFSYDGERVITCPIKGTRPRGKDSAADQKWKEELEASAKDRAEHIMIVDLERNDLGRFCRFGSVRVPELMKCEPHPTVWHLVSTVEGVPDRNVSIVQGIRSAFPGGSITGAPKVRAMEIIDELEPVARGVYTGSIGYLGIGNQIDLNIAIRTVVIRGGRAYFHVGGGIVADSDPESEYEETIVKGLGIARALAGTMRG